MTKVICFLSYAEDRSNTNTSIIYACKCIQGIFPKVGLLEETKERGNEENNDSE
jgi:hypothetical protein